MEFKNITNLYLIAGLMTKGYAPIERRKEKKQVIFVFETDEELENLCNDFFNGRMMVDAQTYGMTLKIVKTSIYDTINQTI